MSQKPDPDVSGGSEPSQATTLPDLASGQSQGLKSKRFQNDLILGLVIRNLLTLKKGSRGVQTDAAVAKIQRALIDAGFPLPEFGPDGIFGSETESAVKQFQVSKGLSEEEQDGKVGPVTLGLMDAHFEDRTKPGLIPKGQGNTALTFVPVVPLNPRYSNPDPFVDLHEGSLRLNGPSFAFLACVKTIGNAPKEVEKWEVGHIQDIIDAEMFGKYSDQHRLAFTVSLPIRDAPLVKQQFPWYHLPFVRSVEVGESVCSPHIDDPSTHFPPNDDHALLELIQMRFKAIDWFVVRNRNTGEIRFLHHAQWGYDLHVNFDSADFPEMEPEEGGGMTVQPFSVFPKPKGNVDPIKDGPGRGMTKPSMTEGIFNEEIRLVKL